MPPRPRSPCYYRLAIKMVHLLVSVLGLDEVGKGLGLLVAVVVVVAVVVGVLGRADVLHLVDRAALGAALDGAVAGDLSGCQHKALGTETATPQREGDVRSARG